MKSIDLGQTGPESPISRTEAPEPYYPSVQIVVPEEKGDIDMPEEGTVTFSYKLKRETTVKREGKTVCEYDLDLTELNGYKGKADERPSKRDMSAEDALDKLAKEKMEKHEAEEDDEEEGY